MANRCYFECYVPVSSLKGETKEYWEEYINKVIPLFDDIDSVDYNTLVSTIKNNIQNFDINKYPVQPYAKINGEYYVYSDDIKFKHCIPDQFLACFDKDDEVIMSVDKSKYEAATKEEKEELENSYKHFIFKTTAKKAKNLLKTHLDSISKENEDYISFGEYILEFLSDKDDKSIITLFSGEICFDDSVEQLFSYLPA